MVEQTICPIMSRVIPLTHPSNIRETYAHFEEIPCIKGRCQAWSTDQLDDGRIYGYCKIIGVESR